MTLNFLLLLISHLISHLPLCATSFSKQIFIENQILRVESL